MNKREINFNTIEKKWQKRWEEKEIFKVKEGKKKKFYILEMFPYPSGSGLHIGHAFNYILGDIYARFKRMNGLNVLYPMGYDSLGLPAENAAIKAGEHPKKYTEKSVKNFIKQQKSLGLSYDWSRMIRSHDSSYYKWDQWIFLQMLKKGIAFRKKAPVNWCEKCQTVLANEQVHNGKCWRHKDENVEIKHLEQWFLKITNYADELHENLQNLKKWPEDVKAMQKNWIGKSHGYDLDFEIKEDIDNCVIVHGSPSKDRTKDKDYIPENLKHWLPWIKENLEKRGIKTEVPQMPTPWEPKYEEWKEIMDKFKVNGKTILIGHSAGGAFLVRWLYESGKKIKRLILVSPGKSGRESKESLKKMYGPGGYSGIKDNIGKIVIFTADDDIDYHIPSAHEYAKELNGKLIHLPRGHGHFCEKEMGTKEFPKLFDEIIEKWKIFTTRPDTLFGVTFMVISAQHPHLMELVTPNQKEEVENFLNKIKSTSQKDIEELEKEGAFTGSYAINPATKEKIPVWVGNFVVADYGCGMVMAVPAHDQRDFEFAKKYNIPIKVVINPDSYELNPEKMSRAFTGHGKIVNSEEFNSLLSNDAIEEIGKKFGKKTINFKLRDWLVSRQRYWGTPIPVIYCDKCGIVPVPEKELPVELPDKVKFGEGNPLKTNKEFVNAKCPKCKAKARRETDTMDTFVNSSWYFLRYCDPKNNKEIFDKSKVKYWLPIDTYIGGKEHATMHLIYFRFYTKFLRDIGLLNFDEPAIKLFNQGMVHGEDGSVMSKSAGNVVLPEEISEKYGIDTARLFLVSVASPDKDTQWSEKGIDGSWKFIRKVMNYSSKPNISVSSEKVEHKINKAIKEITSDIEQMKYNLAVIKLRCLFDSLEGNAIAKKDLEAFVKMLSVFCPHIAEELWEKLGGKGFVSLSDWPKCDEKKINEKFDKQEQAVEKIVSDILNILKIVEGKKIYVYALPHEKEFYSAEELSLRVGKSVEVFAVNDKKKYDPQEKSKKVKPGRPGIYIE